MQWAAGGGGGGGGGEGGECKVYSTSFNDTHELMNPRAPCYVQTPTPSATLLLALGALPLLALAPSRGLLQALELRYARRLPSNKIH